ncbi:MAG: GntR family transcriptional regulator [Chitinispirillaceae bacterium]|nr:GntR family transcriptional regulator [Chitinispirillaceae bacterium]
MAFRFSLNNKSGVPYYRQIVNRVIYGVANEMLLPGERLPTVRQLSVDLQVNLNTIAKAYSELELRGIVNTQQGTGTFVSQNESVIDPSEKEKGLLRLCRTFLDEISALGIKTDEAFTALKTIEKERKNPKKGS